MHLNTIWILMDRLIQYSIYNHQQHHALPPLHNIHQMPKNIKEDTASDAANSEQHTASSPDTDRSESSPHQFWIIQTIQDTRTLNNQGQSTQVTTDHNWKISQN